MRKLRKNSFFTNNFIFGMKHDENKIHYITHKFFVINDNPHQFSRNFRAIYNRVDYFIAAILDSSSFFKRI